MVKTSNRSTLKIYKLHILKNFLTNGKQIEFTSDFLEVNESAVSLSEMIW